MLGGRHFNANLTIRSKRLPPPPHLNNENPRITACGGDTPQWESGLWHGLTHRLSPTIKASIAS